jgi:alpha-N-arabinofuranosidase
MKTIVRNVRVVRPAVDFGPGRTLVAVLAVLTWCMATTGNLEAEMHTQTEPAEPSAVVVVGVTPQHAIDPAIFGQFLEIASWGEPGPEALADPQTGRLPDPVVDALRQLHAPVIRFPGGSDMPEHEWRDRVGPVADRPISQFRDDNTLTNRFGYPQFLTLCEELDAEPLLVLNLKRVLTGVYTAAEVADLAAYCNAPVDPRRAADGRAEPWNVRRWQIGNELFTYIPELMEEQGWSEAETARRIADAVAAVSAEIRKVTPEAEIIFDGYVDHPPRPISRRLLSDPVVREAIDLPTFHHYAPWGFRDWTDRGVTQPLTQADADRMWMMWTAMPGGFGPRPGDGGFRQAAALAQAWGYDRWATTEWNWNGWQRGEGELPLAERERDFARSLGNGALLNDFIRRADRLVLGNQSMMLGVSWNIAAVFARPNDTDGWTATPTPSGLVTGLWSREHGRHALPVELISEPPGVMLDTRINRYAYRGVLPLLDVAATADLPPDGTPRLVLHVVHREREDAARLRLDLTAWPTPKSATLHTVVSRDVRDAIIASTDLPLEPTETPGVFDVMFPPASVGTLGIAFDTAR